MNNDVDCTDRCCTCRNGGLSRTHIAHVELPPGWYSGAYQRSFGEELRPVGD